MDGAVWFDMPSHAPSVLHGVPLVLVFAHCIGYLPVANLESHHPSRAIFELSVVVRLGDVILD